MKFEEKKKILNYRNRLLFSPISSNCQNKGGEKFREPFRGDNRNLVAHLGGEMSRGYSQEKVRCPRARLSSKLRTVISARGRWYLLWLVARSDTSAACINPRDSSMGTAGKETHVTNNSVSFLYRDIRSGEVSMVGIN